jgi:hypothetical protein
MINLIMVTFWLGSLVFSFGDSSLNRYSRNTKHLFNIILEQNYNSQV